MTTPKNSRNRTGKAILYLIIGFIGLLAFIAILSSWAGFNQGEYLRDVTQTVAVSAYLEEQYVLALQNMANGDLWLARERFEFIYTNDPHYRDAGDKWVEISLILNLTATATPVKATETVKATATVDPRPAQELFAAAQDHLKNSEWSAALDTLSSLRKTDITYRTVDVDGMIYTALLNRGKYQIISTGDLEGGLYDLSQAEQFGPLDATANTYKTWAHYYLLGNSFWFAYPETAASYYGAVVNVAPNLKDANGVTAWERYWLSLIHIGQQHVEKEAWCEASGAYAVVLNVGSRTDIIETATAVFENCLALTPSSTPTFTPTSTATYTVSPTITATGGTPLTGTPSGSETATSTPTAGNTNTSTNTPIVGSPTFTRTPTPVGPSATFTNTPIPASPTFTSTPTPTFTATP